MKKTKKIIKLIPVQHIYELERCAGCQKKINEDEFYEIGLPSGDGKSERHIALCEECNEIAEQYGI